MSIVDTIAGLTPSLQTLARPYSVYVTSTAVAVAILRAPSPDMLWVGAAIIGAIGTARTCDKIWGRQPPQGDQP